MITDDEMELLGHFVTRKKRLEQRLAVRQRKWAAVQAQDAADQSEIATINAQIAALKAKAQGGQPP